MASSGSQCQGPEGSLLWARTGLAGSSTGNYFDLENPVDLARLSETITALELCAVSW
jgi:hypothetical protein